jgi:type I restriction enzyme S subunit
MAQCIFKEWFVEFNFPNEEGVPYKDNGGEMVESELGEIPEGWRIEELGNISTFNYGKMPKKSLLNTGDFPTYSGYKYQYSYPEYNCEKKDLIVVARGVGGTGDVKLVKEKCYLTNLSIKFSLNENSNLKEYLYYKFKINNLRYLDSGSAQSQITIGDLNTLKLIKPSEEVLICFKSIIKSLLNKMIFNDEEGQILIKTRDELLPKLMSGEVRV